MTTDLRAACQERISELRSTAEAALPAKSWASAEQWHAVFVDMLPSDAPSTATDAVMNTAEFCAVFSPSAVLLMLDGWAEIVERHEVYKGACDYCDVPYPCADLLAAARALGVETP